MPDTNPRRGSSRLRALLKNLHHQTWELELLISGLVSFALFQLPGPLAELQRVATVQVSEMGAVVLVLGLAFLKLALYSLITSFVLHLTVRAFWVGLVGLDSVFPRGVRRGQLRLGPASRELADELPSIRQLIVRTDAFASVIFAVAFSLVIVFASAIPAYGSILAVGFGVAWLLPGEQTAMDVFWGVWVVFMVVTVIPGLIDRIYGTKLSPTGWLYRLIRGFLRRFQFLTGYRLFGPVQLTLSTHLGARTFGVAFATVFFLLMGLYTVNDNLIIPGRGIAVGSPYLPVQAGPSFVSPEHYDDERDGIRARLEVPSIPSRVIEDPFLPLFVPYRPAAVDGDMRALCPELERIGRSGFRIVPIPRDDEESRLREDRAEAALACASQLWRVELNGVPTPVEPVFTRHTETGIFGLVYMIPVRDLEEGRHTLVVARVDAPEPDGGDAPAEGPPELGTLEEDESAPRRFTILFWKAEFP